MIVCHIETSAGSRFSQHANEEELRQELISYNNDTLNSGEPDDQLPEDAELSEAIEKIEESENVSWEEIWEAPKLKLFMVQHDDDDGNNFDLHVEAADEERAAEIWRDYYWPPEERDEDEDYVPERVFLIETKGVEGAVVWNCTKDNR
jgi:hypothetical protein